VGLIVLAAGFFGLALFFRTQGLAKSTQWMSLLAGAFAIAAVVQRPIGTVVSWLRPGAGRARLKVEDAVEELAHALNTEWKGEERRRAASNPEPLPVRWTVTREAESAMGGVSWDDLGVESKPVEPQLLAGVYDTIHETFTRLPRRRLIVLGRGGGGKSSLARRLARDLLIKRASGDPVPVFLSVASWGPEEDLDTWAVKQLIRDHPGLEAPAPETLDRNPVSLSRALVDEGHLLLILDGFDEIPGPSRENALLGINNLGDQVPMVVTSRTDEYQQAVVDFGRGLSRAAVVELASVDAPAIKNYLTRTTSVVPRGRWDKVFALLDRANGSAVAQALRTPLMIWLTRVVYQDKNSIPADLTDTSIFSSSIAIENHLLDELVMAIYGRGTGPWGADQVRRWLGFLARWLQDRCTADLAWWRLSDAAPRRLDRLMAGLPVGLAAGVPAGFIIATMAGLVPGLATGTALAILATARAFSPALIDLGPRVPGPILGRAIALATGLGIGLPLVLRGQLAPGVALGTAAGMLAGLAAGFLVHAGRSLPTRVTMRIRSNRLLFLKRVIAGLLIGLVFGVILGVALGSVNGFRTGLVFGLLSLAMGLALGIVDGLHLWIDTPTDISRAISPETVLSDDRAAALVRALVAGLVAGAGAGLTSAFAYGPVTGTAIGCAMAFAYALTDRMTGLASSCWGSFTLTRAWLALREELPWRLMAFLDEAHHLGVLRWSGAVYQFRHARLQQRLAVPSQRIVQQGACSDQRPSAQSSNFP